MSKNIQTCPNMSKNVKTQKKGKKYLKLYLSNTWMTLRMWSSDLVEVPAEPKKGRAASEEGFVVVADGGEDDPHTVGAAEHPAAADGYAWRRQLVYRGKLTMHTAFERPDNVEPAAVTAVSVSKDHRSIYVGDSRGRVFSWMVASRPGKGRYRDKYYVIKKVGGWGQKTAVL